MLAELSQRPALNGGWEKLARQQDEQCKDLRIARRRHRQMAERLAIVETWIAQWNTKWKWLIGLLGTLSTAVVAKIIVEILQHAKLIPW